MRHAWACAAALLFAGTAGAAVDEAAIRATLKKLVPDATPGEIRPSAMAGLAEVIVGGQVLYVSEDGRYVVSGTLYDGSTAHDLTEQRRAQLRAAALSGLAPGAKIAFAPESPAHRVTVFTAVDCGYCRRFHQDIAQYNAKGIAIDYVMIPLRGPGSPGDAASRSVYCADDRAAAFTAATRGETVDAKQCASDYDAGVATAASLGITTTPTLLAADGTRLGGYLTPDQLLQRLQTP